MRTTARRCEPSMPRLPHPEQSHAMSPERANKSATKQPRCPSCAQPMRLVRKTVRFNGLPDLCTFECRTCNVSLAEECGAPREMAARTDSADPGMSMSSATRRAKSKDPTKAIRRGASASPKPPEAATQSAVHSAAASPASSFHRSFLLVVGISFRNAFVRNRALNFFDRQNCLWRPVTRRPMGCSLIALDTKCNGR